MEEEREVREREIGIGGLSLILLSLLPPPVMLSALVGGTSAWT